MANRKRSPATPALVPTFLVLFIRPSARPAVCVTQQVHNKNGEGAQGLNSTPFSLLLVIAWYKSRDTKIARYASAPLPKYSCDLKIWNSFSSGGEKTPSYAGRISSYHRHRKFHSCYLASSTLPAPHNKLNNIRQIAT